MFVVFGSSRVLWVWVRNPSFGAWKASSNFEASAGTQKALEEGQNMSLKEVFQPPPLKPLIP